MTEPTFLWHDYETFGTHPRRDRPAQFAAIRTDMELREIGAPLMWYCQPATDYLPDPGACLLTGITPQACMRQGLAEHQFAALIEAELARSGTIGVGYNSIRFDDEVTRFMLWRNLMDSYAREWQNGCGRWDILDMVRAAYALRPEGIAWPTRDDGRASFRLEDLSAANGLRHEAAHDALSDVRATIALARLLREKQPRLFDFCLGLHKKERVAQELGLPTDIQQARPFLHVSGMFDSDRGCMAVMWPLTMHPGNRNELLAWDLSADPSELAPLSADAIRIRLFTRGNDLPDGVERLPIKSIHLNRSPVVVGNLRTLTAVQAQRWGLDWKKIHQHAEHAAALPDMSAIWRNVYSREEDTDVDVDENLYGGFIGPEDRRRLNELRALSPEELAHQRMGFDDPRLGELVFRYRARNFEKTLSAQERGRWQTHCAARLIGGEADARTLDEVFATAEALGMSADYQGKALLKAVCEYAQGIAPIED